MILFARFQRETTDESRRASSPDGAGAPQAFPNGFVFAISHLPEKIVEH